MQPYREIEREEAKEVMEQDLALAILWRNPIFEEAPMRLEDLLKQNKPEVLVDKTYRLHQEQRKVNKKVNLSFNRLAFSVKQQISVDRKVDVKVDRKGEKNGTME